MNTDLVQILQLTINGVAIGSIYALVALVLSLMPIPEPHRPY